MKIQFLFTFSLFLLLNCIYCDLQKPSNNNDLTIFKQWKEQYGKQYSSDNEETFRMIIFLENYRQVQEQNQNIDISHKVGINQFSDLSDEEFNHISNGVKFTQEQLLKLKKQNHQSKPKNLRRLSKYPSSKNWVSDILQKLLESIENPFKELDNKLSQFKKLYSARDQGKCGCCWAFASAKLAAYRLAIDENDFQQFSEQQLIDCVNIKTDKQFGSDGCDGGFPDEAFSYINIHGISKLNDYQVNGQTYTASYNGCKLYELEKNFNLLPYYKSNEPRYIGDSDDDVIEALQYGPLVASLNSSNWRNYKSGIFNTCGKDFIGHAVVVVGYTPEYWIIQNQWGPEWGEDGFMKLGRQNNCSFPYVLSYQI